MFPLKYGFLQELKLKQLLTLVCQLACWIKWCHNTLSTKQIQRILLGWLIKFHKISPKWVNRRKIASRLLLWLEHLWSQLIAIKHWKTSSLRWVIMLMWCWLAEFLQNRKLILSIGLDKGSQRKLLWPSVMELTMLTWYSKLTLVSVFSAKKANKLPEQQTTLSVSLSFWNHCYLFTEEKLTEEIRWWWSIPSSNLWCTCFHSFTLDSYLVSQALCSTNRSFISYTTSLWLAYQSCTIVFSISNLPKMSF